MSKVTKITRSTGDRARLSVEIDYYLAERLERIETASGIAKGRILTDVMSGVTTLAKLEKKYGLVS